MAPPELTGDTPVTDIFKPVEICLIKMIRYKFCLAIFNRINRRTCKWFHLYEPLFADTRLYRRTTAVAGSYIMIVIFYFYQCAFCFQIFYDGFTCFVAVHSGVFLVFIDNLRVVCHYIDNWQIVAKSYFKVVRVVCRRDLYDTGSKFHIYVIIRNQRNLAVNQWKDKHFSNQIFVSFIVWIDSHRRISQKSFRTGCRQIDITASIRKRIAQMPEMSLLIFVLYLGIGNGCQTMRAPVDDTLTAVDQSFIIKFYKYFLNGFIAALVHRKTLSVPITGRSHFLKLGYDTSAVLFFPVPGTLQKFFTSDILFRDSLFSHRLDDLRFGRNRRMVSSRKPKSFITLHSLKTNENVLQRIVKGMSHVKLSRDVWWRNYDRIRFLIRIYFRMKILLADPFGIKTVFNVFWIIIFFQFFSHDYLR